MTKRVQITVRGVVQGVGFRMYTQREAARLGVRGYVRNRPDGAVEIVAEGNVGAIDHLIAWAKHGPPAAEVDNVEVTDADPAGDLSDFHIRH
jgi:acylphosphatase